jgi:hypothetical protein
VLNLFVKKIISITKVGEIGFRLHAAAEVLAREPAGGSPFLVSLRKPVKRLVCADPMKIIRSIFTMCMCHLVGSLLNKLPSFWECPQPIFRALPQQERYQQLDDWINDPLNIPKAHATPVPGVGGKVRQP